LLLSEPHEHASDPPFYKMKNDELSSLPYKVKTVIKPLFPLPELMTV
jgi:hypothetical protein